MICSGVNPKRSAYSRFTNRYRPSLLHCTSMTGAESVMSRSCDSLARRDFSARLRSMNCPNWRPMSLTISRKSSSGSRTSRLMHSITPRTSSVSLMGKQKAECNPSFVAAVARGKLLSLVTSRIQAGSPLAQTRPGRPIPWPNLLSRVTASNSGTLTDRRDQKSMQVSWFGARSTSHIAPSPHPPLSHRTWIILGAASASAGDSAKMRLTASLMSSRCSKRLRSETTEAITRAVVAMVAMNTCNNRRE